MNLGHQFIAIPQSLKAAFTREGNTNRLTGNGLLVFYAIMQFFPNMFPSVGKICEITGLHRQTVFKYLKQLESLKILKRFKRRGTSNVYELNPFFLIEKVRKRAANAVNALKIKWENKKNRTTPSITSAHKPTPIQNNVYIHEIFSKFQGWKPPKEAYL